MMFAAFFLALLVVAGAEICSEEKAEKCVENLLSSLIGDSNQEEVCRELQSTVDCLQEMAKECLGDEENEELKDGLRAFENLLEENCRGEEETVREIESDDDDDDDVDSEMAQCFAANEDYIYECIFEGSTKALSLLIEQDNVNVDALKCTMYSLMAECFVERITEKCGEEAGRVAEEELADTPDEIQETCHGSDTIDTAVELLEEIKKKKK